MNTTGEALDGLYASLDATNVLSKEYRGTIVSYALKIAELAYKDGQEKGYERGIREATPAMPQRGVEA